MSRSRKKQREQNEPREMETLFMLTHCKGGFMRAKQDRKKKEHKRDWMKEIDNDLD